MDKEKYYDDIMPENLSGLPGSIINIEEIKIGLIKLFSIWDISEEEKQLLDKDHLRELNESWVLEWEFVYDRNWEPMGFISINDLF